MSSVLEIAEASPHTNRVYAAALVPILFVIYLLGVGVYQVFFHPLRTIPGPALAKLTSYYLTPAKVQLKRCYVLRDLHNKYGPVVRVGPNEVSFSSWKMYRPIYTFRGVIKDPDLYRNFEFTSLGNVFAAVDPVDHASRKKIMTTPFSYQQVVARSDLILIRTDVMVSRTLEKAASSPTHTVDVGPLLGIWSVEVICKVAFNCDVADEQKLYAMLHAIETAPISLLISSVFPILKKYNFSTSLPGSVGRAYRVVAQWKKETAAMLTDFQKQDLSPEQKMNFLAGHLFSTPLKNTGRPFTFDEALEESMGVVLAGAQVTQHTLMYLIHAISRPEGQPIQERLRKEIQGVGDSVTELMALPFLTAVIKETYRVHPALISTLPRVLVQPLALPDPIGVTLPPGTAVGMQNFVHHRDPELFPRADSFIPERWLEGHELCRGLKDMDSAITPFSLGTRSCLGQNLAQVELYLGVARLLRRIHFTVSSSMKDDDMVMEDTGLMHPRGNRLLLDVRSLED